MLGQDPDSVYQLEVDKKVYDVTDPEFVQIHCLRFEIERSSGNANEARTHGVKITDIDYYLGGNRHSTAKAEQVYTTL